MKKIILFLIGLIALGPLSAQNNQVNDQQRWGNQQRPAWQQRNNNQQQSPAPNPSGQFSPAEYWKQQQEFFTQKACLTEEEAKAFFPVYNELQQKKRDLNREIRRIMREGGEGEAKISEERCLKAIDTMADVNIKIAELEKEYLQKFKELLPASKILKIQDAEEQFNSQILKDIQQSRGHQFQQGQPRPGQQPQQQRPQFNRPGN